jgi:branched-chain amino acid transport system substrate-binding protein
VSRQHILIFGALASLLLPFTAPVPAAAQTMTAQVQGVTGDEIRFGMAAPLSGPSRELGQAVRVGIEAAFRTENDDGGVNGRMLRLIAADDGYEPSRTADAMRQLYERDQVFGFVGNVGTPTAAVAAPFALERRALFFGAFTGAGLLRRDPPDRYVFNYRASYAEETYAAVRYLVKVRKLKPEQIAVFAQQDAFGDSGFAGVDKAIRALRTTDTGPILRVGYQRNTIDVDNAVSQIRASRLPIKAIVMVATYRPAAKFIEKMRPIYPGMIFTNVSFVGSSALRDELMLLGPKYASGVMITQTVPALDGKEPLVLQYRAALAKYFRGEAPDFVSLEGFVAAQLLIEALRRVGPVIDTERLVSTLENMQHIELGLNTPIAFSRSEHQGCHKVWATQLTDTGKFDPINLQQ